MSVTAIGLFDGQFAPNSTTTIYTSTGLRTIIDKFTALNTDSGSQTITVYIVPNGSSAADSNAIVKALSITAGSTTDLTQLQNHILNSGDFIAVVASVASKIAIRGSGRQVI